MPTSTLHLSTAAQLRVRKPSDNSSGSVLLKTADGIWDCVGCKKWTEIRYTEEDWLNRYTCLHGVRDEEESKQIAEENENEELFKYKDLKNPKIRTNINVDHCKVFAEPTENLKIAHDKWNPDDGTLELFITRDIQTSKRAIASTEYLSLLLTFEQVVFEEEEGAAVKRTRSD